MHERKDGLYDRARMMAIINAVLTKVGAPQSDMERQVYRDMQDLKNMIEHLRRDLRGLSADDISRDHVPGATDELDAVVSMTEDATNRIMNACDGIQSDIADLPPDRQERLQAHMTAIFEACTFQDITSQRIAKVMTALKKIDARTQDIMRVLQTHFFEAPPLYAEGNAALTQEQQSAEQSLMNGPQLPGRGVSQDDIDRILRECE